jgi:hypothetical protein
MVSSDKLITNRSGGQKKIAGTPLPRTLRMWVILAVARGAVGLALVLILR